MRQPDHSAPGVEAVRAVWVRRFDCWAADYDASQLQSMLFGPAHEAVVRYARLHVPRPGRILDVGCGTGRLAARIAWSYRRGPGGGGGRPPPNSTQIPPPPRCASAPPARPAPPPPAH